MKNKRVIVALLAAVILAVVVAPHLLADNTKTIPKALVPANFQVFSKTVADANIPLALGPARPCAKIWVAARMHTDGTALNTSPVFIRHDATNSAVGLSIAPTDFKGYTIEVDDPAKVFVKAVTNGDGVFFAVLW